MVYVDDILIIGSSSTLVHDLITKFHLKFALKKLGNEVTYYVQGSIVLSMSKYIKDLLTCAHMPNSNGASTPMLSSLTLRKFGPNKFLKPRH